MEQFGIVEYLAFAVLAGLIALPFLQDRARAKQVRRYARRHGLVPLDAPPPAFPLRETSLAGATYLANVIGGRKKDKEILIFDARFKGRRGPRFDQTVLAVRASAEPFGATRFDLSLTTERAGEWTLLYRRHSVLPVQELHSHLSGI